MKAIRGAINFREDSEIEIKQRTSELLHALMKKNNLKVEDLICVFFSLTEDITSMYPAAVFRSEISSVVPLFSSTEPKIKSGMPLMLRVLFLHNADSDIPIYLYEAKNLRRDLFDE